MRTSGTDNRPPFAPGAHHEVGQALILPLCIRPVAVFAPAQGLISLSQRCDELFPADAGACEDAGDLDEGGGAIDRAVVLALDRLAGGISPQRLGGEVRREHAAFRARGGLVGPRLS